MAEWKNLDTLDAYKKLVASDHRVDSGDGSCCQL